MNILVSLILFFNLGFVNQDLPLQITIDEVRSTNGSISVSVFLDQESFAAEKPYKHEFFPKSGYSQGSSFTCSMDLPYGAYGVVVLDDENENNNMDYNWMGVPKEGYGFSNFIHKGFSKPDYSDFEFILNEKTKEMNISLRYF